MIINWRHPFSCRCCEVCWGWLYGPWLAGYIVSVPLRNWQGIRLAWWSHDRFSKASPLMAVLSSLRWLHRPMLFASLSTGCSGWMKLREYFWFQWCSGFVLWCDGWWLVWQWSHSLCWWWRWRQMRFCWCACWLSRSLPCPSPSRHHLHSRAMLFH